MSLKLYPNQGEGFTAKEILMNHHTLYMDVTCHCGKEQSYATYMSNSGTCIRCGDEVKL